MSSLQQEPTRPTYIRACGNGRDQESYVRTMSDGDNSEHDLYIKDSPPPETRTNDGLTGVGWKHAELKRARSVWQVVADPADLSPLRLLGSVREHAAHTSVEQTSARNSQKASIRAILRRSLAGEEP